MSAMSDYRESRHDPAPSRWSYRLLRMMLTPFLRRLVFFGIPAFALAAGIGVYLSEQDNRDKLRMLYSEARLLLTQHPEVMVNLMAIEGASDMVDQDI
ncbi:MAG: cell division protein FtsQ, partial [Marinovum sp.]|nr:cell division protein FtsQ [Marinovum sp.]